MKSALPGGWSAAGKENPGIEALNDPQRSARGEKSFRKEAFPPRAVRLGGSEINFT